MGTSATGTSRSPDGCGPPAIVPPIGASRTTYYNTGDWRESCTALIEDPEGRLHLIRDVHGRIRTLASGPRPAAATAATG